MVSVGHSFFEKGYSASELRTVISEKIDDLVSSGACEFGTKELLIANYDIFYLEMNRWNTQPWHFGDVAFVESWEYSIQLIEFIRISLKW